MARTDILWADSISSSSGGGLAESILGEPDGRSYTFGNGDSVTLKGFRRASYTGLAELLGSSIAGDVVTPAMVANADIIAFELNGQSPAMSGGWESCQWEFSDGQGTLLVRWNEGTIGGVFLGQPAPRDPHVVANGSITGAAYSTFFGIPESVIVETHTGVTPQDIVISFLLFRIRPEIDVRSPAFEITLRGVPPMPSEATPDADAVGVLVHETESQASQTSKTNREEEQQLRRLLGWGLACEPILTGLDLGRDLKLTADGRDFAYVEAIANLNQSLEIALTTALGSDIFNTQFGFDGINALVEETNPILMRERVRIAIIQLLRQDPRIRRIVDLKLQDRRLDPANAGGDGSLSLDERIERWRTLEVLVVFETISGNEAVINVGLNLTGVTRNG